MLNLEKMLLYYNGMLVKYECKNKKEMNVYV